MKRLLVCLLLLGCLWVGVTTSAQAQRRYYGRRGYYYPGRPVYRPYGGRYYYRPYPYAVPRYYRAPPYRYYGGRYYYRPRPYYYRPGARIRL